MCTTYGLRISFVFAVFSVVALSAGCDNVPIQDILDVLNINDNGDGGNENVADEQNDNADDGNDNADGGNDNGDDPTIEPDRATLTPFATNTSGASGLALDGNGNLYLLNADGLYGPLAEGDDISELEPIGATNLDDEDIFKNDETSLVLAISNEGEFWIGSRCCGTLAFLPVGEEDAVSFKDSLLDSESQVRPETMVIVPDNVDSMQILPGTMLIGQESSFSILATIDVDGDHAVVDILNPEAEDDIRYGHHLAFGPDGTLYASTKTSGVERIGFQTIGADGVPTDVAGTEGLAANSFVVLDNGDILMTGFREVSGSGLETGLFIVSPATGEVESVATLAGGASVTDRELVLDRASGAIYLARPGQDDVVLVTIAEE